MSRQIGSDLFHLLALPPDTRSAPSLPRRGTNSSPEAELPRSREIAPSKLILACTDACHLIKRGRVRLFRVDSHVLSGSCLSRLPIDVVELKPIGLPGNVHANSQIPKSPHNLFSAIERNERLLSRVQRRLCRCKRPPPPPPSPPPPPFPPFSCSARPEV